MYVKYLTKILNEIFTISIKLWIKEENYVWIYIYKFLSRSIQTQSILQDSKGVFGNTMEFIVLRNFTVDMRFPYPLYGFENIFGCTYPCLVT